MKELVVFEIKKLLQKPLVWAFLAYLALFFIISECYWVCPGSSVIRETDRNGKGITIKGVEAIKRNQEIADRWHGPLTDEKAENIIEAYRFQYSAPSDMDWIPDWDSEQEAFFPHNLMYDTLSVCGFVKSDGRYSGATVEGIFGDLSPNLVLGYSSGWENTIYILICAFLCWGCIIVILVAPAFSEEYTRHMDALILTGSRGRTHCPTAKILACYLVTVIGSLLILGIATLLLLVTQGFAGYDSSVQLGKMRILRDTPYVLSWLEAYGLACIAWFGGVLVLTTMTLVISALAKSSFSALVIAFTVFCVPMFLIPCNVLPEKLNRFGYLLPITQIQLMDLFRQKPLSFGDLSFPLVYLALPVTLVVLLVGIPWSRRTFTRHQVA